MSRKQTVLIYRKALLPLSETFIKEQALALRDWRPVLVGRRLLDQLPLDGLDVRVLGPQDSSFLSRLIWKVSTSARVTASHIKRALELERPALVHAHFGPDALDAWPLARSLGLPMLVTLHGYDINTHREWWEAGNGGSGMRHYPRRLLQLAQQPGVGFIAVSQAIRRRAIEFGIAAEKIAVNYIGIDTRRFVPGVAIESRPRNVLFVGRLVEKKGCRHLIEAMSRVRGQVPDARLVVIGDGPLRQNLEALARSLQVDADFRGALGTAGVQHALSESRVLCLPSVTAENGDAEGFGLVLLEAQASGVPVVTSARGGADEGLREGVTGYAFPEGDSDLLATRLLTLLTEDVTLRRLAEEAPRYVVEHFDVLGCARQLEAIYAAAVAALTTEDERSPPMGNLRQTIAQLPVVGPVARSIYRAIVPVADPKFSSARYWEDRYSVGGNSGAGSYGRLARFKAETLNRFVEDHNVRSVIEFGSGDGAQLELARYPTYTGIDVSARAIELCREKFRTDASKRFLVASTPEADAARAELSLSLDVIYHLVEDAVFEQYMTRLVAAAGRFIGIYSSNTTRTMRDKHVRHRQFTGWMTRNASDWKLLAKVDNPFPEDPANPDETSWADFYFYEKL